MSRHWSEDVARAYLEALGYETLASNYSIRGAEIDLIMQDGSQFIFVEVKQRKSNSHGTAAESINSKKLERLQKAALHFVVENFERDDLPMRFDAVLLSGVESDFELEHLKNIST